jgi:hypothetical protein
MEMCRNCRDDQIFLADEYQLCVRASEVIGEKTGLKWGEAASGPAVMRRSRRGPDIVL